MWGLKSFMVLATQGSQAVNIFEATRLISAKKSEQFAGSRLSGARTPAIYGAQGHLIGTANRRQTTTQGDKATPIGQDVKLEKEVSKEQESFKEAEESYVSGLLNLMVAKVYLSKFLVSEADKSHTACNQPENHPHPGTAVNAIRVEEAIQAQDAESPVFNNQSTAVASPEQPKADKPGFRWWLTFNLRRLDLAPLDLQNVHA
jgi:hypothetical protein